MADMAPTAATTTSRTLAVMSVAAAPDRAMSNRFNSSSVLGMSLVEYQMADRKPPRLKTLGTRIGSLPPRIAKAGETEAERARRRDRTEPFRKLYRTGRWQKLRWSVLLRDRFQCRQCGLIEPRTSRIVCDHIIDHGHDEAKFWVGADGLQTLCATCHSAKRRTPNAW